MTDYTINGIQQIGLGVTDAKAVFNWYRKHHGFDILVFEDEAEASLMTQYTNFKTERRKAFLAMNMQGGGGLEIWQFKNRIPEAPKKPFQLGDLGINMMKLRSSSLLKQHVCQDDLGNWIELVHDGYQFESTALNTGGVLGATIGVSNMEASIQFFGKLLGLDRVLLDEEGVVEKFKNVPGGQSIVRAVVLGHSNKEVGGFGKLLGPMQLELVQVLDRKPNLLFEQRLWGDLGYIHLCFDVFGMDALKEKAAELGHNFTVDSANSFDMGKAAGRFGYLEDPDGTLIELVETHKVPISKPLGLYINLKNRNPRKPLPNWIVRAMKIHRVKKDL